METLVVKIDNITHFEDKLLQPAIELLQKAEVVAIPTETVYGLAANAYDASAVGKIFTTKGRPSDNPLIVHISSLQMLKDLVKDGDQLLQKDELLHKLIQKFWPGPITFLLPKSERVPLVVTAGLDKGNLFKILICSVAVRMPSHPVAKKIIELSHLPLAAPSANLSGKPSPTTANHVLEDLQGKIGCVVDGGSTDVGVESTVIDLYSSPPLILRPGGVTFEQLKEFVPSLQVYEKKVHGTQLEAAPPTPGLKYRHYSPMARVVLFEEDGLSDKSEKMAQRVVKVLQSLVDEGKKVGLIQTHPSHLSEYEKFKGSVSFYPLGDENSPDVVAKGIFGALRDLDSLKVDVILVEGISEKNEGLAVMNRIRKAAAELA